MVFNQARWPALYAVTNKLTFEEAIFKNLIKNRYNPIEYARGFKSMLDFFDILQQGTQDHLFITDKIRMLVDFDPRMVPILERETKKPTYWTNFSGTVSYQMTESGFGTVHVTALLYMPKAEEMNGKHIYAIAVFVDELFAGHLVGEDFGINSEIQFSVPGYSPEADPRSFEMLNNIYVFCKQLLFFLDNCEERTNYILSTKVRKIKTLSGEKYLNDIKAPNIRIIDSSYFTTTVRSGEFEVSGHWRMQVCGEKMLKRKLIWISDFVKHGYTHKATITFKNN